MAKLPSWRVIEIPTTRGDVVRTVAPTVARINADALKAVVYLYASEKSARVGDTAGGTGFLARTWFVGEPGHDYAYIVTNNHVVAGGFHTVRVNLHGGGVDAFEIPATSWISMRGPDDIAVAVVDWNPRWDAATIFVASAAMSELPWSVGVGDDAVMLGRLSSHAGTLTNEPVARFGNIAKMAVGDPVLDGRGMRVEAFLVEMRTIAGFSGSPVFAHLPARIPRSEVEFNFDFSGHKFGRYVQPEAGQFMLLGIDTGHKVWKDKIFERREVGSVFERRDLYAQTTSGMAIVAPAWKIRELLDHEDVDEAVKRIKDEKQQRDSAEAAASDVEAAGLERRR